MLTTKENTLAIILICVQMITYRVIIRMFLIQTQSGTDDDEGEIKEKKNLLLIGVEPTTRDVIKSIHEKMKNRYNIIGIIDDRIIAVCEKYKINEIFLSTSKLTKANSKPLIEICQKTGAKVRILPTTVDLIKNKNVLEGLKEVEIEDLLGRDPIKLDNNNIESSINSKVILVTGGGGSIGSELCRQIALYNPEELVILDIYENNLYDIQMELQYKFPNLKVDAIVGSVRDEKTVNKIFKDKKPYIIFHAAAHKHVPLMERNGIEALKNNVIGTYNVVKAADRYHSSKFILISTDKAVNPTNIMGASKRMCEMIVQAKAKS